MLKAIVLSLKTSLASDSDNKSDTCICFSYKNTHTHTHTKYTNIYNGKTTTEYNFHCVEKYY